MMIRRCDGHRNRCELVAAGTSQSALGSLCGSHPTLSTQRANHQVFQMNGVVSQTTRDGGFSSSSDFDDGLEPGEMIGGEGGSECRKKGGAMKNLHVLGLTPLFTSFRTCRDSVVTHSQSLRHLTIQYRTDIHSCRLNKLRRIA